MEIINLLELPRTCKEDKFFDFVDNTFKSYIDNLGRIKNPNLAPNSCLYPKIREIINAIQNALSAYYSGSIIDSYGVMQKCLDSIKEELLFEVRPHYKIPRQSFYRMRICESSSLSRKDMFHVPFQQRNLISQGRYSISGVPCLYISDSVYTCWEELNRPNLNKCFISRVDLIDDSLRFLDFSWQPKRFFTITNSNIKSELNEKKISYFKKRLQNYYLIWPLLFITTINPNTKNSRFNPQYIISNLLMEWISRNEDIDGIKYFSSKIESDPIDFRASFTNIAIPVRSNNTSGYCDTLSEKISITDPILGNEHQSRVYSNNMDQGRDKFKWLSNFGCAIADFEMDNKKTIYMNTVFGKLEFELSFKESEILRITKNKKHLGSSAT